MPQAGGDNPINDQEPNTSEPVGGGGGPTRQTGTGNVPSSGPPTTGTTTGENGK